MKIKKNIATKIKDKKSENQKITNNRTHVIECNYSDDYYGDQVCQLVKR